jgi:long-chain acyl-CoA synthetase
MSEQLDEAALEREQSREVGMSVALMARNAPERLAVISRHGDRTFGELNANANRLVRVLRGKGLREGDAVALLCSNRAEFIETWAACLRSGLRLTCINWHLQAGEVAYIVDNCEARALLAEARFAPAVDQALESAPRCGQHLAIAGEIPGFDSYEGALRGVDGSDISDPVRGATMLYTSGTTGRPKGVYRKRPPAVAGLGLQVMEAAAYDPESGRSLLTGPAYHAAPIAFDIVLPIAAGVGVVMMDGWDAEETLQLISRYSVTNTHLVATMFQRLLALPDSVKSRYDLSSLNFVLHGAAPTPLHVKKAMIDWLGPVIYEYYAGTEGGGCFINSEDWLAKPGSVGKPSPGQEVHILDADGQRMPTGEIGTVYFRAPELGRFEYYRDQPKTASAYRGNHFTMGDHGYVDEDGYVFLTGRTSEMIISGGVNIFPAEVDAVLLMHPAVADVATVGIPSEEWGEEVKSVVQLVGGLEPSAELAQELIELARQHLARFKCPRSIDFDPELPRQETGKIYRRLVRDRYWEGQERQI